ncbi:hypothetical protein QBC33DRAFT_446067 [Phialemonium atrogriseum]|uniref:Methyltransferase type 11 domain-containing protein n=1 Tax=Phialemonium atrogriseum TaxID=1093897 RepID=A0AAJ0C6G3_9PEZI|nr:uncharacterized protein QBC33DRAFT_446067 [Phialemonium atrogriseum]KAK1770372.1 hypothetical protein QBC33DRAFT_446067 [Phialemonium atrogriseum]
MGGYIDSSKEVLSSIPGRKPRKEPDDRRTTARTISQPKVSSRIPQAASQRRPSLPSAPDRPTFHYEAQPWGSVGRASSGGSASNPYLSSTSSSGRLATPGSGKPRNVLQRKHSGLSQETGSTRNNSRSASSRTSSSSSSVPRSQSSLDAPAGAQFDRDLTESPMELRVAQKVELPKTTAQTVTIYPELDRYRDVQPHVAPDSPNFGMPYRITTHDLPPPTPLFSGTSSQVSGSPSTRFSGSPGPGPYSRDTTPTSLSSQSPGLVAPMRIPASKARQPSPAHTRPPVTRRRAGSISNEVGSVAADPHGLAAVRESLTSSSSNSTVRDGEKQKKKKKRLSPLPPSPPPRKSSQKFHGSSSSRDEDDTPPNPSRDPAQPVSASRAPARVAPSSSAQLLTSPKATPPVRPSRDGTPDLQSQLGLPLPIIHSNLSSISLSERRHSSTLALSPPPSSTTPSYAHRQHQSRPQPPIGRDTGFEQSFSNQEPGRPTRTPSPNVSAFKTRFPIFGRRTKTAPEVPQLEKKDKTLRKGPAAGTGHEGYGRIGAGRRRSSSASISRGVSGIASSQESLDTSQTHDAFLMERMAPVVIAGGEIIENRNMSSELSRTESNQSSSFGWAGLGSKNSSQASLSSKEGPPRHTLWPSAFPRGHPQSPSLGSRRPSDSSDSEALAMKSTLAFRRSRQKLKAGDQQAPKIPKPIVTRPQVISPSITSLDASVLSDDSVFEPTTPDPGRGRTGGSATAKVTAPKKLTKRTRSPRKWNFFGRSQSQPAVDNKRSETTKTVAATVKAVQAKPVAFYTMMDSSEQEEETPNLEDVLREARALDNSHLGTLSPEGRRPSATESMEDYFPPLDRPPTREERDTRPPVAVPATVNPDAAVTRSGTGRPSRLPQVGRIPKVVSARPEQTSPRSFSRPFHRISMHVVPSRVAALDTDSVAKGPTPPRPSTPELTQDGSTVTGGTNSSGAQGRESRQFPLDPTQGGREFLSFSPRKNSQCTVTTSSGSSGILTYADATAVVPDPSAPLAEDEIWDEYNDLLGDDTGKPPLSVSSSLGRPFHLDIYSSASALAKGVEKPLESPIVCPPPRRNLDAALQAGASPTAVPSFYDTDTAAKMKEVLSIGPDPPTPFSMSEFVSGYGDRNNSLASVEQVGAAQKDNSSCNSDERQTRRSNASGSSQGSEDNSPLSQVNLRVGSMTVSKWLTFGHVLFSPVRDDLIPMGGSSKRQSILVIDGLGNDDWSFYAAETYPAATFFNLSPRAPLPTDHQSISTFPLSPQNHHQIQYVSQADKFPFGPQSFTSVVFRFPAAAPEGHYRNVISEARRVLKPGGFIELSILDVDLNNMGNRGRRSVRRLKERIHASAPDTSLGSTADLILRLLGRGGFTDIRTCRVGVPVASTIARSSGSEGNSKRSSSAKSGAPKAKPDKDERTLAEMMSDESAVADESITNMVAKVGRWWYSRCYESAATSGSGPGSNRSLWSDRALLAECEEWGTSLKLMVCHARVPDKGRVASI